MKRAVLLTIFLMLLVPLSLAAPSRRIRPPRYTNCMNLPNPHAGELCWDTDADGDGDGTPEGQLKIFADTDADGVLDLIAVSGTSGNPPGGADTQVQYNDSGAFGGQASFAINKTSGLIHIASGIDLDGDGTPDLDAGSVASTGNLTLTADDDASGAGRIGLDTDGDGTPENYFAYNMSACSLGEVLKASAGGVFDCGTDNDSGGGGSTSPGGSDTDIQYNDSGSFGGQALFSINKTSGLVRIDGGIDLNNDGAADIDDDGAADGYIAADGNFTITADNNASGTGQIGFDTDGDGGTENVLAHSMASCVTGEVLKASSNGVFDCGTDNGDMLKSTYDTDSSNVVDNSEDLTCTNCVTLSSETTGNYVSDATANKGLALTGTEGATLGLIETCADGQILKWTAASSTWACAADGGGSGGGTPGGSDTQVQYNDSGAFAGQAGFAINKTSGLVRIDNGIDLDADGVADIDADGTADGYVAADDNLTLTADNDVDAAGTIGFDTDGDGTPENSLAHGMSACTTGQVLKATASGVLNCGTDDTGSGGGGTDPMSVVDEVEDFTASKSQSCASVDQCNYIGSLGWYTRTSGTAPTLGITTSNNHPGILRAATAAATPSAFILMRRGTAMYVSIGGTTNSYEYTAVIRSGNSGTTTQYFMKTGLSNSTGQTTEDPTSGVYFRATDAAGAAANIFGVCRSGGTETTVDLGVAFANSWHTLKFTYTTSSVEFFLDGVSKGTCSTNIPTIGMIPVAQILTRDTTEKRLDIDLIRNKWTVTSR